MIKLSLRLTGLARRQTLFALALLATAALTAAPTAAFGQSTRPAGKAGAKHRLNAEAIFDRADKDHDGKISKEEFRKALASIPGLRLSASKADKLFARLDRNKDGFLTKDEVKQLPARLKGMLHKEGMKRLFGKLRGAVIDKIAARLKAAAR
jgi:hypothetical protein